MFVVRPAPFTEGMGSYGILSAMRTTLELDDNLMESLLSRHPGLSKTDVVELAIKTYLENDAINRIRALRGKIEIEDVSRESRQQDRRTL